MSIFWSIVSYRMDATFELEFVVGIRTLLYG